MLRKSLYLSIFISIVASFCSFADAYTGAYMTTETDSQGLPVITYHDVDPTGQTYSGQNVIEYNALDNTPNLTSNTFNGSTEINPAYTDITSTDNTYNGTTDVNYLSSIGGNLQSTNDIFQTANVSAADADVAFTNPEFNGSVTLQANSISVGSISQMDTLLDLIEEFKMLSVAPIRQTTNTYTYTTISGQSNTITLAGIARHIITYNPSTRSLSVTSDATYGSYSSLFEMFYEDVTTGLYNLFLYIIDSKQYDILTFSADGEYYNISSTATTSDYHTVILNRFDILYSLIRWYCDHFFAWYYPLDDVLPVYWRYYNTDTQQSEEIGLAGLMYNISWYLGQLYALQVESGPLAQLADDVESASQNMAQMEQNENAVISSVTSSIDSFVPDLNDIGAFTALAWCSNYLQQCWVSLGMYGTVIVIALMLGVCMQFIGYFRYK